MTPRGRGYLFSKRTASEPSRADGHEETGMITLGMGAFDLDIRNLSVRLRTASETLQASSRNLCRAVSGQITAVRSG